MQITARYYGFFSKVTGKLYEVLDVDSELAVKDLIDVLDQELWLQVLAPLLHPAAIQRSRVHEHLPQLPGPQ